LKQTPKKLNGNFTRRENDSESSLENGMHDREYKRALTILRRANFLQPTKNARANLLDRLNDRQAGIVTSSVIPAQRIREFRFVSRFKYALVAMLLIISLFNTGYLITGGTHAFEHRENSLQACRNIGELIRELRHAALMLTREGGEKDEM
jgi:hypothetical protein